MLINYQMAGIRLEVAALRYVLHRADGTLSEDNKRIAGASRRWMQLAAMQHPSRGSYLAGEND